MARCDQAWHDFLLEHPSCDHREAHPAGTAGLAAYAPAPFLAWSGWRLRVPGGPEGGQYHGFIGPDETNTGVGWPDPNEILRPMDNPAGLGAMPWQEWDQEWGGIPLAEGETVSDYVYRGPAEIRPRPNASGGVNTVRAAQTGRSAGYAIAPGNYKGIGYVAPVSQMRFPSVPQNGGGVHPVCPAWGCGPPPIRFLGPPQPAPVVAQSPPPVTPSPAPIVMQPYPVYLPESGSPAPAPTVAANTCPTGYALDANGNCVPPGAAGSGIGDWLGAHTSIGGVQIPNYLLAGVGALVAFKFLGGKR